MIIPRLLITCLFATLMGGLFATESAIARVDLLRVSSVYSDANRRIQGTGTPIEFERVGRGKPHRVIALLTSAHVSGGTPESLQVFDHEDNPRKVIERCGHGYDDIELLILDAADIPPLGKYNPSTGWLDVDPSKMDNWHFDSELFQSLSNGSFLKQLWGRLTKSDRTISVAKRQDSTQFAAFVPKWIANEPVRAALVADYNMVTIGTYESARHSLHDLPYTSYGGEIATRAWISPGMSGAPVVGYPGRSKKRGGTPAIVGISSRMLRYSSRSYFVAPNVIRELVENARAGRCDPPLVRWHYWAAESGAGFTYRTVDSPLGTIQEVTPLTARAGNAEGNEGGNGESNEGGGNGKILTLGYDPDPDSVSLPSNDIWKRLGIEPGVQLNSRPVVGFLARHKFNPISFALSADVAAIDFLNKRSADFDIVPIELRQDKIPLLRQRFKTDLECFRAETHLTSIFQSGFEEVIDLENEINVTNDGIDIEIRTNRETLKFSLDRTGALIGGPNPFYTPFVTLIGPNTGANYTVDLSKLFFISAADVYSGSLAQMKPLEPTVARDELDRTVQGEFQLGWVEVKFTRDKPNRKSKEFHAAFGYPDAIACTNVASGAFLPKRGLAGLDAGRPIYDRLQCWKSRSSHIAWPFSNRGGR